MNTQQFAVTIESLRDRLITLTQTKGEEYKRRDNNQFANFERGALALGLTREQVLMVYLSKHLDSITTYVRDAANGDHRVYAEPMTGRIDDAILYLLLLRGMMVENDKQYAGSLVQALDERNARFHESGVINPGANGAPVPEVRPTFVMSSIPQDAMQLAQKMGLQPASSVLNSKDQMHGLPLDAHIIFLHHGNANDEQMYEEVVDRGYSCECRHL